ncbi:hypothetical protein QWY81_17885 [Polaribacter undariae]|uniref:Uncharacterized protein n=1 Tax=Polaribacter sejongensis TaxID=985043 RepID=A0AAJ1VHZ0_9FLAO|nr:hypothetical protein [Polaribacter undariae]MDN3621343.1 hypothetical protein [Polaribacter undariae]UWD31885.1 hypothetical protein NQP51_17350 [Polaribacter undariae]
MAKDLKKIAAELLKDNPEQNKIWMTEDGQGFFSEGHANNNAKTKGLENPEVFFRDGHQDEDSKELEEVLLETEETVRELETVIDRVIDVSNIEAEDSMEALEDDHQAVKNVAELRKKYEGAVEQGVIFKEEIKEELEFNAAVVELVKNDTTKLADAIRALIPTKTT